MNYHTSEVQTILVWLLCCIISARRDPLRGGISLGAGRLSSVGCWGCTERPAQQASPAIRGAIAHFPCAAELAAPLALASPEERIAPSRSVLLWPRGPF